MLTGLSEILLLRSRTSYLAVEGFLDLGDRFRRNQKIVLRIKERIILKFFITNLGEILHVRVVDGLRLVFLAKRPFVLVRTICSLMSGIGIGVLILSLGVSSASESLVNVIKLMEEPILFFFVG